MKKAHNFNKPHNPALRVGDVMPRLSSVDKMKTEAIECTQRDSQY